MDRRHFLKNFGLVIAGSIFPHQKNSNVNPESIIRLGRVTSKSLSVHSGPSEYSRILFQRELNDVLNIYGTVESDDGPGYNPYWHRVWGGFVHSGFVQPVRYQLNPLMRSFPSIGALMELTVPFSQSFLIRNGSKWEKSYILFYGSTHWVFDIIEGLNGNLYYEIHDGLTTTNHYVAAEHLRLVDTAEFLPIHPEVNPTDKHIEISIDFQSLRAYEYDQMVKEFKVSTGNPSINIDPDEIPTDTPRGNHIIRNKYPSVHMGDGTLRNDAEAYELPGVPWVSYFEPRTGVAIHGAYWHNNFGRTMSHGCVNMKPEDAKWIYRWSTPYPDGSKSEYHTKVIVIQGNY